MQFSCVKFDKELIIIIEEAIFQLRFSHNMPFLLQSAYTNMACGYLKHYFVSYNRKYYKLIFFLVEYLDREIFNKD